MSYTRRETGRGTGGAAASAPGPSIAPSAGTHLMPGASASRITLKPGYSQMDWMRRSKRENLRGDDDGGDKDGESWKTRVIDDEELGRHATRDDCWIALRGRVYNLTGYVDYHPGGEKILEQTYGKDATALFDKYHKYVNGEYIMAATQVGIRPGYVPDSDSE